EDHGSAGEDLGALRAETGQLQIADPPGVDHPLDDLLDRGAGDAAVDQTELVRDLRRGLYGAGRADGPRPPGAAEPLTDRAQLELHLEPRLREAPAAEPAVAEELPGEVHAADLETLELPGLVALADDQLRAAAADVDDERRARDARRIVRDAEVDQPRLLDAGDHLDGMPPERLLGRGEKRLRVPRAAQGARADDPDPVRLHVPQPLPEALEARERALLAFGVEVALLVEARREPHHLAQPVEDGEPPVLRAGDHDMEAVRPEVDGGDDAGILVPGSLAAVRQLRPIRRRRMTRSRRSSSRSGCG